MRGKTGNRLRGRLRQYRRYPEYTESNIEWLGEIPAHWQVRRLKTLAAVQLSNVDKKSVEGEEPVRLCNYTDVYYNDHITDEIDFMSATATTAQIRRFSLRQYDVLITKDSESWTDIAVPSVVDEDLPNVLCGYHVAHIRPNGEAFGPYLARAFSAVGPRDQFHLAANGITRFGLGGHSIAGSIFAIPPEPEQRAIAAFLDQEIARIDALVEKKEQLIELLQEQRAALITRVVTKGLNPDVRMKHSGIEWLGEIPAHWETRRLKYLATLNPESLMEDTDPTFEMVYVDIGSVNNLGHIIDHQPFVFASAPTRARRLVRDGDVIVSTVRTYLRAIAPIIDPQPGMVVSTGFAVVRPMADLTNEYAAYALRAPYFVERVVANSTGVSFPAINESEMATYELPLPPKDEQRAIASFLDQETPRIDALVMKVRDAIGSLKELRAALISAAVTGKIDVRGETA